MALIGGNNGRVHMNTIIVIIGIFAGIGVFLSMMYSMTQVLLLRGRLRLAHATVFGCVLVIMALMYFWREVPIARLLAIPTFAAALWTFAIEKRWFKIFPVLVMLFAVILLMGYVAV